jgi:hypothetical protein
MRQDALERNCIANGHIVSTKKTEFCCSRNGKGIALYIYISGIVAYTVFKRCLACSLLLKVRNYCERKHRSTTPPQGKRFNVKLDIKMYLEY